MAASMLCYLPSSSSLSFCPIYTRRLTVSAHGSPRLWYNLDGKAAPLRKRPQAVCFHCIAPFLGSRSPAHPSHLGLYDERLYKLPDTESKQGLPQLRRATSVRRCTSPRPFERQSVTHSISIHKRSLAIDEVYTATAPGTLLSSFPSL